MEWGSMFSSIGSSIASGLIERKKSKEEMKQRRKEFSRSYSLALAEFETEKRLAEEKLKTEEELRKAEIEAGKAIESNRSNLLADQLSKSFSAMYERIPVSQINMPLVITLFIILFVLLILRKKGTKWGSLRIG